MHEKDDREKEEGDVVGGDVNNTNTINHNKKIKKKKNKKMNHQFTPANVGCSSHHKHSKRDLSTCRRAY
jgi:hypothetical protein